MAARRYRITMEIESLSPLLMDAMSEEMVERILILGERPPADKESPREVRAKLKLYLDPETGKVIGIPAENFLACLREAGRKVKAGGKAISTATTTTLYSFLGVQESFLILTNKEWRADVRRGVMKTSGKAIAVGIVRPRFEKWGFRVTLELDLSQSAVTTKTVEDLVRVAGNTVGLCSFRPACNGPFGRFKVAKCEVVELAEEDEERAAA